MDQVVGLLESLIEEVKGLRTAIAQRPGDAVCSATLTREQAADYIGVHADTLYRWARENRITYIRMGEGEKAPMRFTRKDLDDYLKTCRIEAV